MWEDETEGFVACFLIKKGNKFYLNSCSIGFSRSPQLIVMIFEDEDGSKSGHGRRGYLQEGAWDAIHVIEVCFLCPNFGRMQKLCNYWHAFSFVITSRTLKGKTCLQPFLLSPARLCMKFILTVFLHCW